MMGDGFNALLLALFGEIIQKEIYQYGVDLCVWGEQQYFTPQELDGPDAAAWWEISERDREIGSGQ